MPDVASTSTMPASAVRSSTTPPKTGTDAPHDAAAPAGDGERHARGGADPHDGGDLVGRRRPDGDGGARRHLAGERPVQRQRPPVAAALGDLALVVDHRRWRRAARRCTRVAARRPRRASAAPCPVQLDRRRRLGHRRRARSLRRASASSAATSARVGGELAGGLGVVPAELGGQQRGDVGRRGERRRPVEQVGPGAARQHVVERRRHLVADGVHGLGAQVRQAGDERLAERRVGGDERLDLAGERAVAAGEVGVRRARRRCAGSRRRRAGAAASSATEPLRPSRSQHDVDGVLGHLAVRRQLAAGDGDDAGRSGRHPVAAGQVGGAAAASPT